MLYLRIWGLLSILFGLFPFQVIISETQVKIKLVWVGLAFMFGRVLLCYYIIPQICQIYEFPSAEPQKYSCYLNLFSNLCMSFNRLLTIQRTKKILEDVFQQLTHPLKFFQNSCYALIGVIMLDLGKLAAFSHSNFLPFWFKMKLISMYLIDWSCFHVLSQVIMICNLIQYQLEIIGRFLKTNLTTTNTLKTATKLLNDNKHMFNRALDCYSFDIIATMPINLLYFCTNFNDLLGVTLVFFGVQPGDFQGMLWIYLLKLSYFVFSIMRIIIYFMWFATAALNIHKEVRMFLLLNLCKLL